MSCSASIPGGTSPAQLGICCGAWRQGILWDSPPFFGMGLSVPFIWSSGDLVAGTGSNQVPRNNPGSPTWRISPPCMGRLDLQVGRALAAAKGSAGLAGSCRRRGGGGRWLGWDSLAVAGLDAHHLWACPSFNICLTNQDLHQPSCFSSLILYQFLMPWSRDRL